jgi:hypothetical protein
MLTSEEVASASAEWGCNCGPAALAACLGFRIADVRLFLSNFERRGYMNGRHMRDAVLSAGGIIAAETITPLRRMQELPPMAHFPRRGLMRIQFGGPWTAPKANPNWAYRHTHWAACGNLGRGDVRVFDINSGYTTFADWTIKTIPQIGETKKQWDGTWWLLDLWDVKHPRQGASRVKA